MGIRGIRFVAGNVRPERSCSDCAWRSTAEVSLVGTGWYWLVLVGVAIVCLSLSVAIFIDIADDGLLSAPLDTLAVLLLVGGVVEMISAMVAHLRIN